MPINTNHTNILLNILASLHRNNISTGVRPCLVQRAASLRTGQQPCPKGCGHRGTIAMVACEGLSGLSPSGWERLGITAEVIWTWETLFWGCPRFPRLAFKVCRHGELDQWLPHAATMISQFLSRFALGWCGSTQLQTVKPPHLNKTTSRNASFQGRMMEPTWTNHTKEVTACSLCIHM